MPESLKNLSPYEAWQPLPAAQWDEAAARHLLQRIGWAASPAETARALADGPLPTLKRYFAKMPDFPKPALIAGVEREGPQMVRRAREGDEQQRRLALQEARERSREALLDLTVKWLQLAARPESAPAEKWLLFLQDVWVVGIEKVRNSALIFQHQDLLRKVALANYPLVAKAMSRSPAMIVYLDLQQSQRDAPNENFARELFELFTLGEGNYTEADIKEAARAFTGYRQRNGEFAFVARQHDGSRKTVFGEKGAFTGDDVIDLVFKKPAAGVFLPREMAKFYLTDEPLPAAHLDALGAAWAKAGYDLGKLIGVFFTSRLFYAGEYRGNFIKSPLHYYLGLLQNLDLSVVPLPRQLTGAFRQMGQMPFGPPNVRGWVGGKNWINSVTLATRRRVAEALLTPLNEENLNADERLDLDAAYAEGITNFTLSDEKLAAWAALPPDKRARELVTLCLPQAAGSGLEAKLRQHFAAAGNAANATRQALAALLTSPDYNLC
jgi:uncharacterized protein (DUF1800 family)